MSGLPSWKSAEIGLFPPFSAFFALFRRARTAPGKSPMEEKGLFPQLSSDLLKPPICGNPNQKPERGYIRMFPGTKNRNEGTFGCFPVPKNGTKVHSPKPPFSEAALFKKSSTTLLQYGPPPERVVLQFCESCVATIHKLHCDVCELRCPDSRCTVRSGSNRTDSQRFKSARLESSLLSLLFFQMFRFFQIA